MTRRLNMLICLAAVFAGPVSAAQTIRLPDYLCGGSQGIFADGYETGGVFSSDPSMGSGGAYPGNHSRSFPFAVLGTQTYYLHVPPQYQSGQAMPVMLVLEGYTGSHANSVQDAQGMRDDWIGPADTYGFIVAVPVNNKWNGSWLPADGSGQTNDYDAIGAALDDLGQAYNIERNRVSVWGFSAGGHIAWDMLLNNGAFVRPTPLNAGTLASMSTSGANSQFACNDTVATCGARFAALPRKVPVDIHIGNSDPNYAWTGDDYQRLLTNGWVYGKNLSYTLFVGGHTYMASHLVQVAGFACRYALQP
ncbi:MAG: hypothetical protein WCD66_10925 [Rhodanobacteraceae bacterium]